VYFIVIGLCSYLHYQAFHPFYVFQIASLILWSIDEYYYYAGCIFLISVVSITTTLIETRSVSDNVPSGRDMIYLSNNADHETASRDI